MAPQVTLLLPEHFCRDPEWSGTTNVFHAILHNGDLSEDPLEGLVLEKNFDFGISLASPFPPPRWTGEAESGPLVSAQADVGTLQPYRIPSGGLQGIAVNKLTRVHEGVDIATFILNVPEDHLGSVSLVVRILWHGVVLAEVSAEVPTSSHGGKKAARQRRAAFSKIFASYARPDLEVVKLFNVIASALAMGELRWDLQFLRPGEDWREGICREILEADSFQLFWSKAACESPNVRNEWTFALEHREKGFIKPIYWTDPMAPRPPELDHITFGKADLSSLSALAGGAGQASSG